MISFNFFRLANSKLHQQHGYIGMLKMYNIVSMLSSMNSFVVIKGGKTNTHNSQKKATKDVMM